MISLIEADPPQARQTLEAFTDWLRASLGHMRREDAPLSAELELTTRYLAVMQARMGGRLRVELDVEPAAREALLPPLMLQPLVENAISHGIEPSLDGGLLRVTARRLPAADGLGERLQLCVDDDGLDWTASARPRAPAAAAATASRSTTCASGSRACMGHGASLRLSPRHPGTRACIELPWQPAPTPAPAPRPRTGA